MTRYAQTWAVRGRRDMRTFLPRALATSATRASSCTFRLQGKALSVEPHHVGRGAAAWEAADAIYGTDQQMVEGKFERTKE